LEPSRFLIAVEKGTGPAPKVKKIAAPNQTAAFSIPTNLRNPITRPG